ncbi:hypothetical protein DXA26_03390 [Bacteroides fragilis]|nr:hypothetical protein DXA26_03390 [Bacteroides fragilis]
MGIDSCLAPTLYHIGYKSGSLLLYLYLNGYNMRNQTIVKYVKQIRREEGVQKRILSFLFPENVILITFYE